MDGGAEDAITKDADEDEEYQPDSGPPWQAGAVDVEAENQCDHIDYPEQEGDGHWSVGSGFRRDRGGGRGYRGTPCGGQVVSR